MKLNFCLNSSCVTGRHDGEPQRRTAAAVAGGEEEGERGGMAA
jgi:hypothetical protein